MKRASVAYKQAMAKQFRDRTYAVMSVGVVNKEAQNSIKFSGVSYLSNTRNPLRQGIVQNTYASFEQNHTKADGQYLFPPADDMYMQLVTDVGIVSDTIKGPIMLAFDNEYDIKGLTIDFGNSYPTEFIVYDGHNSHTYTNNQNVFTCTDVFEEVQYLIITPIHFVDGDKKRLRINYILMGVGLTFTNDDIEKLSISETTSYVSEELPTISVSVKVLDPLKLFNVDDPTSFIRFLDDGQRLDCSIGQTLANGSIEYIDLPATYLSGWGSDGLHMSFSAKDRFTLLDGTYSAGNYIHERTLYQDAIDVLTAAGLEPDEYFVDTYLQDLTVTNPLPAVSYAECLQLIANASRCSLTQSTNGKILIEGGFENIIEPTELIATANEEAAWSHVDNIRVGSNIVYADFTKNFASADGSMLFLPTDSSQYLGTAFVSADISNLSGKFGTNPQLTLELPARYTYHGLLIEFGGNHPRKMKIQSYYDDTLLDTFNYTVDADTYHIFDSFIQFNKLVFTITEGEPQNRVLIKKISLGEYTDYYLDRDSMINNPVGMMEPRVKDVRVKVCSFEQPENPDEDPKLVEDNVYVTETINSKGQTITFENQLIGTEAHAELIAKWLAAYYKANISYSTDYRGDPRLEAGDIIYMENDLLNNLQVEIESCSLEFSGGLKGKLNLRRAVNMMEDVEEEA